MSNNFLGSFNGILFIGDPHVSSERPGRRTDDYLSSSIDKLWQASRICNEKNLLPVILGDLIHRESENSIELVYRLSEVLKSFPCTPVDLEGNHGKKKFNISESDIEALLALNGRLHLLSEPLGRLGATIAGKSVELVGFPYGSIFPEKLEKTTDWLIGLSHHDLLFGPGYPGAVEPAEIVGVDFVVNGHIHKTYPSKSVGSTVWHCPGNTEPLSVDTAEHKPAVWEWAPDMGTGLTAHYLVSSHTFDMTGRLVNAATEKQALEQLEKETTFAPMLALSGAADSQAQRTDDISILSADVDELIEKTQVSELAAQIIKGLLTKAT